MSDHKPKPSKNLKKRRALKQQADEGFYDKEYDIYVKPMTPQEGAKLIAKYGDHSAPRYDDKDNRPDIHAQMMLDSIEKVAEIADLEFYEAMHTLAEAEQHLIEFPPLPEENANAQAAISSKAYQNYTKVLIKTAIKIQHKKLKQELKQATKNEDYERASKIKETLKKTNVKLYKQ